MINALLSYSCAFGIRAILSTLREKIRCDIEREQFRTYIADCLWAIAKNTAMSCGGTYFENKFGEGIRQARPADNRTGDEIAADVIRRAGLDVVG